MSVQTVLNVEHISKRFESIQAVDEVSFSVERGEILGFLGPNGAGKTTTIRMILGIFDPDAGEIRSGHQNGAIRIAKERTGYLPEERGLYSDAKVLDLLVYFAELKGLMRADAQQRARTWLERFDLIDWQRKKVEKLSKGMQQKVQFIASVLHGPDLVVLDEPFSGLDPVNQDLLKEIIGELRRDGAAILLSSHQMNRVEELCDRIFLIHRGRRVLYGALDEIKEAHGEHVAHVRFKGDGTALENMPGVTIRSTSADRISLTLSPHISPDEFVRGLPEQAEILALHVDRPPLHDLFVRTIGGDDEAR